jgi:hypothetical protein
VKQAIGWILVGIGVLVVGGTLDDLFQGQVAELFSNLTIAGLFGVGGAALVRSARNDGKRRIVARASSVGLLPGGPLPVEALVLRAARAQAGRITPAAVAAATALPYADAKAELDRLVQAGACTVVVGEGGLVVYRFVEFEDASAKREAI